LSRSAVPSFTIKYEECEIQGSDSKVAEDSNVMECDAMFLGG
jgi:hypothetical protein